MRQRFTVTYEVITQESAEYGEAEERGFIGEDLTLRDALANFHATRTNRCDGGDGLEVNGDWLTMHNGMEYETGAYESRSLHLPRTLTAASRLRLIRYLRTGKVFGKKSDGFRIWS